VLVSAVAEAREAFDGRSFPLYGMPTMQPLVFLHATTDGVLRHAKLDHGSRETSEQPWLEVIAAGPLHGVDSAGRQWEEDYSTLALFHVVVANNPAIDGREIPAAEAELAKHWSPAEISLDGQPHSFQLVRDGQHWAATRHIEPDHAIVICASNIETSAVQLIEIDDIEPYLAPA
jgi:hypothetical protein